MATHKCTTRIKGVILASVLILLFGCSVGPDFTEPTTAPEAFFKNFNNYVEQESQGILFTISDKQIKDLLAEGTGKLIDVDGPGPSIDGEGILIGDNLQMEIALEEGKINFIKVQTVDKVASDDLFKYWDVSFQAAMSILYALDPTSEYFDEIDTVFNDWIESAGKEYMIRFSYYDFVLIGVDDIMFYFYVHDHVVHYD